MHRITSAILLAACAIVAPLSAEVTYQGRLSEGGAPASGVYDLRLTLYDDPASPTPLDTMTVDDMTMTDGYFVVDLEFSVDLDGSALWLGIEVRSGASSGAYTALEPRQRITATPYATNAAEAATAQLADAVLVAGDADTLEGKHGATYRAWSGRTGVPADLADGDDDALGDLACAAGQIAAFDGTGWACAPDRGSSYVRTVVVGPVGDAAANGAALLAAVGSLPSPSSREDAWRLLLEPGRYDLGSAALVLPSWLAVVGSGEKVTVITSDHCAVPVDPGGTVVGAPGVALSDLAVENGCADPEDFGRAIHLPPGADDARLTRVTVVATGYSDITYGVVVDSDGSVLERVNASASGGERGSNALVTFGAQTLLLDCSGHATGSTVNTALVLEGQAWVRRGIFVAPASSGLDRALYVAANADIQDAIATGGDVSISASVSAPVTVVLSRLTAQGGITTFADSGGSLTLFVEHSRIVATGPTVNVGSSVGVAIAATQLWGDAVTGIGTAICSGVWDESWTPYANTCP